LRRRWFCFCAGAGPAVRSLYLKIIERLACVYNAGLFILLARFLLFTVAIPATIKMKQPCFLRQFLSSTVPCTCDFYGVKGNKKAPDEPGL